MRCQRWPRPAEPARIAIGPDLLPTTLQYPAHLLLRILHGTRYNLSITQPCSDTPVESILPVDTLRRTMDRVQSFAAAAAAADRTTTVTTPTLTETSMMTPKATLPSLPHSIASRRASVMSVARHWRTTPINPRSATAVWSDITRRPADAIGRRRAGWTALLELRTEYGQYNYRDGPLSRHGQGNENPSWCVAAAAAAAAARAACS